MSTDVKEYTAAQVEQHCTHDSLWIIYDGKVYDMTSFYPQHPGGTALLRKAGKASDVTTSLQMVQAHGLPWQIIQKKLAENQIGVLKRPY
ncbi:hypothetical protein PRIPAC_75667 [Pristionchus pacificus]|uniref:Cytochrome b5 heme-binding domain-containing protein n=1 Tax=Pristionchus pacificus TaxID=54126 RepID=A0A2A6CS91_PRIPA|nr:hypothetical protein PRIPAC_75667 [Pristionchus pacificus]|eukprot:PDM80978.1 hypothetical protein PRIPAC_35981 [Pristionchus pacificus]